MTKYDYKILFDNHAENKLSLPLTNYNFASNLDARIFSSYSNSFCTSNVKIQQVEENVYLFDIFHFCLSINLKSNMIFRKAFIQDKRDRNFHWVRIRYIDSVHNISKSYEFH